MKFEESNEPCNVPGFNGRFLYKVDVVDNDEYEIPDWVEEEDRKKKETQSKKDGKRKQQAKQSKKSNQPKKKENSAISKSQEKNPSSELPAPQVRLIFVY